MKRFVPLAAGLMLAGCATLEQFPLFQGEEAPPVSDASVMDEASVMALPEETELAIFDAGPAPSPRVAPLPKEKPEPQPVIQIDPAVLVGLSQEEVRELIGHPLAIAERAPSKIWSYRADDCALDIFFYLDVGSSTFRALAFDLTNGQGLPVSTPLCLGRIRASSNGS